jgi:hypothetical protein
VTERPGGRGGRDRGDRGGGGERAERTLSDAIGADAPRDRGATVEVLTDLDAFAGDGAAGADDGDEAAVPVDSDQ